MRPKQENRGGKDRRQCTNTHTHTGFFCCCLNIVIIRTGHSFPKMEWCCNRYTSFQISLWNSVLWPAQAVIDYRNVNSVSQIHWHLNLKRRRYVMPSKGWECHTRSFAYVEPRRTNKDVSRVFWMSALKFDNFFHHIAPLTIRDNNLPKKKPTPKCFYLLSVFVAVHAMQVTCLLSFLYDWTGIHLTCENEILPSKSAESKLK